MTARREPISRRERPAKPALSRHVIVDAAVRLMRAEGLHKVTMRRLAQELDTGPASLYVYVANTAELHAAVLDALLGEVDLSGRQGGEDWREQLRAVMTSYTLVLFAHPQLARSALVARPSGENYLRLVERILDLLSRSGRRARRSPGEWTSCSRTRRPPPPSTGRTRATPPSRTTGTRPYAPSARRTRARTRRSPRTCPN